MKSFSAPLWLFIALAVVSCGASPPPFDEHNWQTAVAKQKVAALYAPHFQNGVYFNPWMPMEQGRFRLFLKWRLSAKPPYTDEENAFQPQVLPDLSNRIAAMPASNFIAWVGHATFLIRTHGTYWLTDPMLSQRALLPKRVTAPALTFEDIGRIADPLIVLISHNHYDHLDKNSLRSLPQHARVFVPSGLKALVQSCFEGEVTELDWWQSIDLGEGRRLVSLPAQHWSRRIGQGRDTTLWASYLLITPETSIYYGGDSGYFVGYREIGRRFPGIDYALIPLTAYHPRWFMHYAHMNAPESIQAFEDLGARYFIPTQWGSFHLGDNPPGYPLLDLERTIDAQHLDPSRFILMDIGQVTMISGKAS